LGKNILLVEVKKIWKIIWHTNKFCVIVWFNKFIYLLLEVTLL
jgi:hypothetical protein